MPKTLTVNNQEGVSRGITDPVYFLELDYSTPIRLTSRETVTFESETYTGVDMLVEKTPPTWKVRFFNQGLSHLATMMSEGAGVAATLYLGYGLAPWSSGDAETEFVGVVGAIGGDKDFVNIELTPTEPFISPFHVATNPVFNHLPPDGFQIQTRQGTWTIQRSN